MAPEPPAGAAGTPFRLSRDDLGPLIGRGRMGEVYRLDRDRIVKLFHRDVPAWQIDREVTATRWAWTAGMPTWRVDGLVEIGDRKGILGEYLAGCSMNRLLSRQPHRLRALASRLADCHRAIHNCMAPSLPSLRLRLREGCQTSGLDPNVIQRLTRLLDGLDDDARLCHGDLNLNNVLMVEGKPRIIDWGRACHGPAAADVAVTLERLHPRILLAPHTFWYRPFLRRFRAIYQRRCLATGQLHTRDLAIWAMAAITARANRLGGTGRRRLEVMLKRELGRYE